MAEISKREIRSQLKIGDYDLIAAATKNPFNKNRPYSYNTVRQTLQKNPTRDNRQIWHVAKELVQQRAAFVHAFTNLITA